MVCRIGMRNVYGMCGKEEDMPCKAGCEHAMPDSYDLASEDCVCYGHTANGFTKCYREECKQAAICERFFLSGDCPYFSPEKENCYPLCDRETCPETKTCNSSAHMIENYGYCF